MFEVVLLCMAPLSPRMTSLGFFTAWWPRRLSFLHSSSLTRRRKQRLPILFKSGFRNLRVLLLPQIFRRREIELTVGEAEKHARAEEKGIHGRHLWKWSTTGTKCIECEGGCF